MRVHLSSKSSSWLWCAVITVVGLSVWAGHPSASGSAGQSGFPQATQVDVAVIAKDGKPHDGLGPGQFSVSIDGKPRKVLWVRHVSRGPGSTAEAARRQAGRTDVLDFAAEQARNVLVIIDELSFPPGTEKNVVQAVVALVDRLGLDDRVAVMRVPVGRDTRMDLTTERPEVRLALKQVTGRASSGRPSADPFGAALGSAANDPTRASLDPDKAVAERERPPTETITTPQNADEAPVQFGLIGSVFAVLQSLRDSPGRKVVAVFSAGVPAQASGTPAVDDVARAAAAARASVYVFGLQAARDDLDRSLDTGTLEKLARSSGGLFTALGRNADKAIEKIVPEFSASYIVGVEPIPTDADGKRHAVKVEVPNVPVIVRSQAWYAVRTDPADFVPPSETSIEPSGVPVSVTDAAKAAGGAAGAGTGAVPGKPAAALPAGSPTAAPAESARDIELQRLMAKAVDYVSGFQREYSMMVAEEHYIQRARSERQETKSDLLLVKQPEGWVSFRDVFEVNGRPVRDREDRLKQLFLDQRPESQALIKSIKDESARYNIGQVVRNINVPLFPMLFLDPGDVWRCRFRMAGTKDVNGVSAVKVAWTETSRPTAVRLNTNEDIAASGTFLIDSASGAVMGTTMVFMFPGDRGSMEFNVTYQRDGTLGMWVPAEMTEVFTVQRSAGVDRVIAIDSRATYSRFRRFQVKTEEEIKIKK